MHHEDVTDGQFKRVFIFPPQNSAGKLLIKNFERKSYNWYERNQHHDKSEKTRWLRFSQ